jgi:hypothetical protein
VNDPREAVLKDEQKRGYSERNRKEAWLRQQNSTCSVLQVLLDDGVFDCGKSEPSADRKRTPARLADCRNVNRGKNDRLPTDQPAGVANTSMPISLKLSTPLTFLVRLLIWTMNGKREVTRKATAGIENLESAPPQLIARRTHLVQVGDALGRPDSNSHPAVPI